MYPLLYYDFNYIFKILKPVLVNSKFLQKTVSQGLLSWKSIILTDQLVRLKLTKFDINLISYVNVIDITYKHNMHS